MGLYTKFVFPRILDVALRNNDVTRLRAAWIPHARGEVLELGIGSGLNLPYYSSEVHRVFGVDPSQELQKMARKRAATRSLAVEYLSQSAEEPLPLADASIDTAVSTWSFCSIPNVALALQHVRRVLRPSGRLVFLEHGRSPDVGVVTWQDRLTPMWSRVAGGCHLNRPIDALITGAAFQIIELTNFYIAGPRPLTYTYQGLARPVW